MSSPLQAGPEAVTSSHAIAGSTGNDDDRLVALDVCRTLAIFFVMAFHFGVRWMPPLSEVNYYPFGDRFASIEPLYYGRLGVDFFFIISGYVIMITLPRCKSLLDFARRRFARLWPTMVLCATLSLIVINLWGPPEWHVTAVDWLISIFFLKPSLFYSFGIHPNWVDGAYWSLFVEVQFYVYAALIFLFFRKNFLVAWMGFQLAVFALNIGTYGTFNKLIEHVLIAQYLPYFSLGVALRYLAADRNKQLGLAAVVVCIALIVVQIPVHAKNSSVVSLSGLYLMHALLGIAFAGVIALSKTLSGNPVFVALAAIGEASYALYLLHQNIGVVAMMHIGPFLPAPLTIGLVWILLVVAALGVFYLFETPVKRWILSHTSALVARANARMPWMSYATSAAPRPVRVETGSP